MKYRFVKDLTSDVLFEAFGKDRKEVFENSALAMNSVICKIDKVEPKKDIKIEVDGKDAKDLLYNWLQEIIALVDIEDMFFSRFEIRKISDKKISAVASGEAIVPEKGGTVVKAVTFYKFNLAETDHGYKATVSLDI